MTMLRLVAFIFTAAFTASAAHADIKTEWIEYTHGDVKLKGYLAYDDAITGKRPAVLVIHAREGMTANTIKNVEMFAKFGYVGFATDIFGYGQGVLPKDVPATTCSPSIRWSMPRRSRRPATASAAPRPSSSDRRERRSQRRSRFTARSTAIKPAGRRASRARC
jgi:dienelactone hydrolase